MLGKELAAMILEHRDPQTIFNTHYSRSTENIPLVKLRMGELGGDDPIAEVQVCSRLKAKFVNN